MTRGSAVLPIAFVLGVVVAVRVPPLAAHDELYHWLRIVQISEGRLFPERVGEEWGGTIDGAAVRFDLWIYQKFLERRRRRSSGCFEGVLAML